MKLIYQTIHIPEWCNCEHHKKELAITRNECLVLNAKHAMENLTKWNGEKPCWIYTPIELLKETGE